MSLNLNLLPKRLPSNPTFAYCPEFNRTVQKKDTCDLARICFFFLALFFFGQVRAEAPPAGKASSHETLIRITSELVGKVTTLCVENLQAAEVTVTLEMDLTNLQPSVALPLTLTIEPKKRVKLLSLSPREANRGWSWSYTYYSTFGSTTAIHEDSYIYALPYSAGKTYRVSQGFNGQYSHFGSDQYAIDWRMPLGTPVHAARAGFVVGVKNDSSVGGDNSKFDWDANYVLIQHSDGTLGQYVHLLKGGAAVRVGQYVQVGDLIGLSGNTGHSTGPHLHFSVFKAKDGKHRQTIPIRYRTAEEIAATLEEGRAYRSVAPEVAIAVSIQPRLSQPLVLAHDTAPSQGHGSESVSAQAGVAVGHP